MTKTELLTAFYMWMKKNDYEHNIPERIERKADMFLYELKIGQKLPLGSVVQAKPEKVCKGSWQLGNNCKKCKRCLDTKPS